ncbi:hypothetical protein CDIK_0720 [Cucumispora dikerogammari]|nr:hypothetical protein CDIK_0720 [Cucumispora dikerogammari]
MINKLEVVILIKVLFQVFLFHYNNKMFHIRRSSLFNEKLSSKSNWSWKKMFLFLLIFIPIIEGKIFKTGYIKQGRRYVNIGANNNIELSSKKYTEFIWNTITNYIQVYRDNKYIYCNKGKLKFRTSPMSIEIKNGKDMSCADGEKGLFFSVNKRSNRDRIYDLETGGDEKHSEEEEEESGSIEEVSKESSENSGAEVYEEVDDDKEEQEDESGNENQEEENTQKKSKNNRNANKKQRENLSRRSLKKTKNSLRKKEKNNRQEESNSVSQEVTKETKNKKTKKNLRLGKKKKVVKKRFLIN